MTGTPSFDIVVPTVGRPCLSDLLAVLAGNRTPATSPGRIVLVDDRRRPDGDLVPGVAFERLPAPVEVLASGGIGPAGARNRGWRASSAEWIAFLDDDVLPDDDWLEALTADLRAAGPELGATQGRLRVPLPQHRRPTDWERNVAGLEHARWATADMAYRRRALVAVGGFDERFPRAFREDADLGLRVVGAGYEITHARRTVAHPVRPASPWVSLRLQAGNADDALMDALHGPGWHEAAGADRGRRPRHLAVTGAGMAAATALVCGHRRLAAAAASAWLAGTAELAWARIAPGPRTGAEVTAMVATSVALPATASYHWVKGLLRARGLVRREAAGRPDAVLLDRDGTLVVDVPYNGDAARVVPVPGARNALDRLRAAGVPLAVVSNQSGVARGLVTSAQVDAVNRRVEDLLGPLGPWLVCPHGPDDGCPCRKPAGGLVEAAAAALGVEANRCAVIGDIGADIEAARAAGARGVLVPTAATQADEVATAPEVAPDLGAAVDLLLGTKA